MAEEWGILARSRAPAPVEKRSSNEPINYPKLASITKKVSILAGGLLVAFPILNTFYPNAALLVVIKSTATAALGYLAAAFTRADLFLAATGCVLTLPEILFACALGAIGGIILIALNPDNRSVQRPESPASRPESPASRPESPASRPESPASRPESPASRPESPASRPESPASRPESPLLSAHLLVQLDFPQNIQPSPDPAIQDVEARARTILAQLQQQPAGLDQEALKQALIDVTTRFISEIATFQQATNLALSQTANHTIQLTQSAGALAMALPTWAEPQIIAQGAVLTAEMASIAAHSILQAGNQKVSGQFREIGPRFMSVINKSEQRSCIVHQLAQARLTIPAVTLTEENDLD